MKCLKKFNDKTIIVAEIRATMIQLTIQQVPNVISVRSLDENFKPSGFSAENQHVKIYDCGKVFAPFKIDGLMLKISTGTSMATPRIAGLVCLLMQYAIKHDYEVQMKKTENMMKQDAR